MGNDLKDTWKETGKGLGHAFRDLGKAIIKSGSTALKKADEWASGEQDKEEAAADEQKGSQDKQA